MSKRDSILPNINLFSIIMSSFALVSRFMTIDLPYYSEWFEYYDKIGINHYYLYYIDVEYLDLEKVLTYFPKDKVTIRQFNPNEMKDINDILAIYPYQIKEDYVLHVDSDEFLYLHGLNLEQFIERHQEYEYFKFTWLMCPSVKPYNQCLNDILKDDKSPKYYLNNFKSMAKTSKITFSRDAHRFNKITNLNELHTKDYFVIHFCYRGVYDAYNKTYFQKLLNHQDKNDILINPDITNVRMCDIPSRTMCYISAIQNNNPKKNINLDLGIESKTNIELLKSFDYQNIELYLARVKKIIAQNIFIGLRLMIVQKGETKAFYKRITKAIDLTTP